MNERISTTELADILARKAGLSQEEAFAFVRDVFDCIDRAISEDKYVKIKGLGTFKLISMSPRESVAVNTGERIVIEGYQKFSFTPEAALKDLINKPFAHFEAVTLNEGVDFKDTEVDEDSSVDPDTGELSTDLEDSPAEPVSESASKEKNHSSVEVISVTPRAAVVPSETIPQAPLATNPVNPMTARKKTTVFSIPVVDKTVPFDANIQSPAFDPQPLTQPQPEIPTSAPIAEPESEDPKDLLKRERSRAAAELLARLKAKQQLQKEEEENIFRPLGRKKPESLSESVEELSKPVQPLSRPVQSLSQRIENKQREEKTTEEEEASRSIIGRRSPEVVMSASKASPHWAESIALRSERSEGPNQEVAEPKVLATPEVLNTEGVKLEGLEKAKERRARNEASLRASQKTYRFPFFITTTILVAILLMISFVFFTQPVWIQDIMGTKGQKIIIKIADQKEASVAPSQPIAQPKKVEEAKEDKQEPAAVQSKSKTPPAPVVEKSATSTAQADDKLWITEAHANPKDYKIVGTLESITLTKGMNLARLSKKYYGCRDLWALILAHNSATVKNADNISLGMVLKIPKLMKK